MDTFFFHYQKWSQSYEKAQRIDSHHDDPDEGAENFFCTSAVIKSTAFSVAAADPFPKMVVDFHFKKKQPPHMSLLGRDGFRCLILTLSSDRTEWRRILIRAQQQDEILLSEHSQPCLIPRQIFLRLPAY